MPPKKPPRELRSFLATTRIEQSLAEEVANACAVINMRKSDFMHAAIKDFVSRVQAKYNNGLPFPPRPKNDLKVVKSEVTVRGLGLG